MTRIGWCPGGRTVVDMLKLYPGPGAVRLFYGFRDPAPTWAGPDLGPLGLDVLPLLSFKVWDLPAMLALAAAIPPGAVVGLSYHHEDEQQDGGDIPPELFVARWVELARAFEGHPKRDQIILGPIFTRYWWEKHPGDLRYWPAEVAHLLDAVGWDIYNSGATYRTPDDLLRVPREMAARTGLPYFVGELGALRLAGDDGGVGRSAWMRAMVGAARADGALAVCWFHKDGWDLVAAGNEPERQTWNDIIRQEAPVTTAPDNLRAARTLLLDHLGQHGLDPLAVGIVGDPAHWGGYHCGEERVLTRDYSVIESTRDSAGLTDDASALDVGQFSYRAPDGTVHNLRTFSVWCVAQCVAGAADTADIREIIYSPDGQTVRRWDRLGRRSSGDDSHLSHTHFSFFRDAIKAGRDQTPLFRRYLTTIGLIESEDDMTEAELRLWFGRAVIYAAFPERAPDDGARKLGQQTRDAIRAIVATEGTNPSELSTALAGLPQPVVDVPALAAALAAALPPDTAGTVDVDELAGAVADQMAARLAS